jgi:carbamoyltransferase
LRVLGINSVYHESAAALVVDGAVVAACEEERFNRVKHAKVARVDNPHLLPQQAIRACLAQANMRFSDIDFVAYSFDPNLRKINFRLDSGSVPGEWGDPHGEEIFRSCLGNLHAAVSELLGRPIGDGLKFIPHHLAHAASAYYPSEFDAAAVLVVDGIGESACSTLAHGEGRQIHILESVEYPHSLGFLWEKISTYLGFSAYDASKTMGLAANGDSEVFTDQFRAVINVTEDAYEIAPQTMRFRLPDLSTLEALFGPARDPGGPLLPRHADVAAALQAATDAAVTALLRRLRRLVAVERLCLAGGVALNCVTNALINCTGGYQEIFIPSAPHDGGTAIGAALVLHKAHGGNGLGRSELTPYLGPRYHEDEVIAALREAGLEPSWTNSATGTAAEMVAHGKVVAWFQDRMEFGPRALGNRSILADPRRTDMRDILNQKVKHREDFRPFAPSVLAEHADDWFELGPASVAHEYMLLSCAVKAERRDRIPAVLHRDGTARLQIVRRQANPRFHDLISRFFVLTGVPLLLNTSFNDSEPIVCTPTQAIATFRKTEIDALFMGDILVIRKR